VSPELVADLLTLCRADILGKGREVADELRGIDELGGRATDLVKAGAALGTKDLKVNGTELMEEFGLTPGPLIGRLQRALLEDVLECPEHNERERLFARAREHLTSWSAS
jgi:tRNA nucleotidyltransferase (CCA-adding enzyme)